MDRLIAAAAWHEQQSLELALLVIEQQFERIDFELIDAWVVKEGIHRETETEEFYRKIVRPLPGN